MPRGTLSPLTAKIEVRDGAPLVTWEPNFNKNGAVRTYKVYGRESLDAGSPWE